MTAGTLVVAQPAWAAAGPLTAYTATVTATPLSLKVDFAITAPIPADTATDLASFVASADGPDADTLADATCAATAIGSGASTTTCYITGLIAGSAYTVTTDAKAVTTGSSLTGAVATVVYPASGTSATPVLPNAPTSPVGTPTGVSGEVNVAWTAGANLGATLANYTATAYLGGVVTDKKCTSVGTVTNCTVAGLTDKHAVHLYGRRQWRGHRWKLATQQPVRNPGGARSEAGTADQRRRQYGDGRNVGGGVLDPVPHRRGHLRGDGVRG